MGDIDIDEESTSFVQAHVDEAYPLQVYHEDDAAGLESALVQGGNPKKKWQNWVKQHKEFHYAVGNLTDFLDRNPDINACSIDVEQSTNPFQPTYDLPTGTKRIYTEAELTSLASAFIDQFANAQHPTDDASVKAATVEFLKMALNRKQMPLLPTSVVPQKRHHYGKRLKKNLENISGT